MGVWIETEDANVSTPALRCHTLYGCVDWNNVQNVANWSWGVVTPCMGVWIETSDVLVWDYRERRHTLYGCVDWNLFFAIKW